MDFKEELINQLHQLQKQVDYMENFLTLEEKFMKDMVFKPAFKALEGRENVILSAIKNDIQLADDDSFKTFKAVSYQMVLDNFYMEFELKEYPAFKAIAILNDNNRFIIQVTNDTTKTLYSIWDLLKDSIEKAEI